MNSFAFIRSVDSYGWADRWDEFTPWANAGLVFTKPIWRALHHSLSRSPISFFF